MKIFIGVIIGFVLSVLLFLGIFAVYNSGFSDGYKKCVFYYEKTLDNK